MPSLGEIFGDVPEVSEVSGVSIGSEVGVIVVGVGVLSGAGVTVGGGGVTVLWQAARIKMRMSGMIFFIGI
jgi:hypothetical protein